MFTGLFIGVSATALIGWFVWGENKDSKKKYTEQEVKPVQKSCDQYLDEIKFELAKAKAENTLPLYRIKKDKFGVFQPERLRITEPSRDYYRGSRCEYADLQTKPNIWWEKMIKDTSFTTLELAEAWLATYIALPEITYYNGPPLEKVVDFNG